MSHTIELRKVSKYYAGEDSVSMGFSRVDLDLDIGEFVAITGESGSGKSTLLNVISGLDTYEEGEMFVCGEDTTAYSTEDYEVYRKTYIGNIFQDFNLINSYTVYQNIELVMLLCGKKKRECRARILELLDLVGLTQYRRTKVSRLSGGQKQRVAIARALAKDAPIIVADEPTGNLDSESANTVMETLSKVSGDKLVVIVTHNYEQAEPYVTRKLTMHDGRIIEDKSMHPQNQMTEEDYIALISGASSGATDTSSAYPGLPASYTSSYDGIPAYGSAASSSTAGGRGGAATGSYASADSSASAGTGGDRMPSGSAGTGGDKISSASAGAADSRDSIKREGRAVRNSRKGSRSIRSDIGKPKKMRKSAELLLGIRNTFNLPAKFMLLFIVYFFVSTAVLSQYATVKNSMHESDLLGTNPYFTNASNDRIIIKKNDESRFTEEDFAAVKDTANIREIVKNDLALDSGVSFTMGDYYVEGPVMPVTDISEEDIAYGHMPEDDYEIVIKMDSTNDAFLSMSEGGEEYIDSKVELQDMMQMQTYEFDKKIRIAGIVVNSEVSEDDDFALYGYSTIYASDTVSSELMKSMMAGSSKSVMIFENARVENESEKSVYSLADVPEGKVYIFEDQTYYYKDEQAVGKDFGLEVSNRFFSSEGKYKVDKVITEKNCRELAGIPADEYDMYYNCVFINNKDFDKLFDKGFYQISAYMENEQDSEATLEELQSKGFTTLAIKDSLSDTTGGYTVVINLLSYGRLIVMFIVLFFIAYGVIKLIMRSRNSYYSTLRILGATQKNTSNILKIELLIMMLIAYGTDLAFAAAVKLGYLRIPQAEKLLFYLTPLDYVLLGAALLVMTLLIAGRYSKSIFTRSAMKAFRGEV